MEERQSAGGSAGGSTGGLCQGQGRDVGYLGCTLGTLSLFCAGFSVGSLTGPGESAGSPSVCSGEKRGKEDTRLRLKLSPSPTRLI